MSTPKDQVAKIAGGREQYRRFTATLPSSLITHLKATALARSERSGISTPASEVLEEILRRELVPSYQKYGDYVPTEERAGRPITPPSRHSGADAGRLLDMPLIGVPPVPPAQEPPVNLRARRLRNRG